MIGLFFTDTVIVRTLTASGSYGPITAPPVTVSCFVDDTVKVVRTTAGDEVNSPTTVYTSVSDGALFTLDSEVTIGNRTLRVVAVNMLDKDALSLPSHAVVSLA